MLLSKTNALEDIQSKLNESKIQTKILEMLSDLTYQSGKPPEKSTEKPIVSKTAEGIEIVTGRMAGLRRRLTKKHWKGGTA